MIARADAALLAWHQDVVDLVQLRPAALCRWVLVAMVALNAWLWWLKPPSVASLALAAIALLGMALLTCSEWLLAAVFGQAWIRRLHMVLFVAMVLFAVLVTAVLEPEVHRGVSLLCSSAGLAFVYFAGCRPPRPRPPRLAGALSGGRA